MSVPAYPEYKDSGVPWLGHVPRHWELDRFKNLLRERDARSQDGSEELLSVSAYTGVTPKSESTGEGEFLSRAESLEGYKICKKNDLVMNIMLAWNRGLGVTQYDGIVSPAYCVFELGRRLHPRFCDYAVRADEFTGYFKAHSAGVIDSRLRLYPDKFGALLCVVPSATEQAAIATFLDRETSKIDALVAEQERLIALLKEKRQAAISHAVTKGLNPRAPMIDSGIEWLGEIPAHWDVVPLKKLTPDERAIMYGIVLPGPDVGVGVPIVKGGDVKGHRLKLSLLCYTTPDIEAPFARARLKPNDIVYSIRGSIGDAELVPEELEDANITQDVARISPIVDVNNHWLLHAMRSKPIFVQLEQRSLGAAVRGINIFDLKRAAVPLPPREEQDAIAEYLEIQCKRLGDLEREMLEAITLLQERRAALISAAVTGKIDVRGLATPENIAQADDLSDHLSDQGPSSDKLERSFQ